MTSRRTLLGIGLALAMLVGGLLLLQPWGDGQGADLGDGAGAQGAAGPLRTPDGEDEVPAAPAPATLRGAPPVDRPLADDEGGLYGVVLDAETGAPLPGVAVHAIRFDGYHGKFALLASDVSDAEGRYRLRGLAECWEDVLVLGIGNGWISDVDWTLFRSEEGRLPTSMRVEIAHGGWVAIDVRVRRAARVEGSVALPDGTPASGASVRVENVRWWRCFPWRLLPPVRTDAGGRFVIDALPTEPDLALIARLPGYLATAVDVPTVAPHLRETLSLRFQPAHRAAIRVVNGADGSAVADAEVGFRWQRIGPDGVGHTVVPARTDAEGRAVLAPVPHDGFSITVRGEGYVTFGYGKANRYGNVAEESAPGLWTATVELVPLVAIEGRVEWPPGGDLPRGAHLRSKGSTRHLNSDFNGFDEPSSDGSFRIRVPPDGTYRLSFFANDQGDLWEVEAGVEAGATEVVLRPVMTKRHEVVDRSRWGLWQLTLRDPQGRPLVSAEFEREGPAESVLQTRHVDGKLDAGRIVLQVAPGDAATWLFIWSARTVDGEDLGRLLIGPLGPEGGTRDVTYPEAQTLAGRVLGPRGEPVQGIELWATPVTDFGGFLERHDEALTDAEGYFVLRRLQHAAYRVSVLPTAGWVPPASQRAAAGTRGLVFRLAEPVAQAITVRDEGGRPVPGAHVALRQRDGARGPDGNYDSLYGRSGEDGQVRIDGIEAGGRYDLDVRPPNHRQDLLGHTDEGWMPHDELVVLREGLAVKGVVRDASGRPMPRVEVWLVHPGGRRETTKSDGIGRFTFRGVAPGEVRLAACFLEAREEGWAPDLDIRALAGDENVELRLDSARDLHVRVEIPEGAALGMETIDLTPAEDGAPGSRKRVSISPQGAALFRGLASGRPYRLWGGPTGTGGYVLAEIGAEQTSVLAPLAQGGHIEGRLLLPPGAEQTGVKIVKRGIHCHAKPLPRGEFRMVGVPPGAWTLEAWCHVDGLRRFVRQTASVGDQVIFDLTVP